ncbi:putative type III secretion protein YscO [Ancylostoma duodenale]|uniref:Putative type III secretion protein YscO n=1 Tax=Ancylostoma duodenale TaxID=51022 RepID=A0A0C2GIA6_9BILA|nr:putative type III secretion protein YscO [Ancylostoma duodenale]
MTTPNLITMPRDDPIVEEERRAQTATDLMRMRLERLQQNIHKPAPVPARRAELKPPRPPPEFVRNVVGSSAAAGSAEYHIYRYKEFPDSHNFSINRKKEQNRLDYIAKVAEQEELDEQYRIHKEEIERMEAERTAKKRAKRQRRKEAAKRKKKVKKEEESSEGSSDESDEDEESCPPNEQNDQVKSENPENEEPKQVDAGQGDVKNEQSSQ